MIDRRIVTRPRLVVTVVALFSALLPVVSSDLALGQVDETIPGSISLPGTVRDFQSSHPDFQYRIGTDRGIVTETTGTVRKPVYAYPPGASSSTTNGVDFFDQWYRDVEGVNLTTDLEPTLVPNPTLSTEFLNSYPTRRFTDTDSMFWKPAE